MIMVCGLLMVIVMLARIRIVPALHRVLRGLVILRVISIVLILGGNPLLIWMLIAISARIMTVSVMKTVKRVRVIQSIISTVMMGAGSLMIIVSTAVKKTLTVVFLYVLMGSAILVLVLRSPVIKGCGREMEVLIQTAFIVMLVVVVAKTRSVKEAVYQGIATLLIRSIVIGACGIPVCIVRNVRTN